MIFLHMIYNNHKLQGVMRYEKQVGMCLAVGLALGT